MGDDWKIRYYREADGSVPVQEFLNNADLTSGELKQIRTRLSVLASKGIAILGQRADILETLNGPAAKGIFSLRCPNTPNNPRILLCAVVEQTFVLLHGFKEQNSSDYDAAIDVAKRRKEKLDKAEAERRAAEEAAQVDKKKKGKRK